MADIGFIGLGNMGGPMARNLVAAGHAVKGFDVTFAAVEAAKAAGIAPVETAAEAARDVEVVFTMLPAGRHVRGIYLGDGGEGVIAAARPGTVMIDSSTIDISSARTVHAAAAEADRVLFCDTDALTTKLWSEYHFGDAHPRVAELAEGRAYDLYLHALPDIAWESDGLRFSPDSRAWFERRLKEELAQLDRPVGDLTGPLGKRLQAAIAAVDTLLGG